MPNDHDHHKSTQRRRRGRRRRKSRRRQPPLTATLAERLGNHDALVASPRPMAACRPPIAPAPPPNAPRPRPTLPRLAAELSFIAAQRDVHAELLPGSPASIALTRHGQLVALLVVKDEHQARGLLGLPRRQHQRDRAADHLWELDRRAPSLMEVRGAN